MNHRNGRKIRTQDTPENDIEGLLYPQFINCCMKSWLFNFTHLTPPFPIIDRLYSVGQEEPWLSEHPRDLISRRHLNAF